MRPPADALPAARGPAVSRDDTLFEFPCRFPIKVMGATEDDPEALARELVGRHVPEPIPDGDVVARSSREGRYRSVTVTITATSREQLDAIYEELTADPRVKVAL